MVTPMKEDNKNVSLDIALVLAIHVKNCLHMNSGSSSYLLVFGRTTNLLNVLQDSPRALHGTTISQTVVGNISELHWSRQAFLKLKVCVHYFNSCATSPTYIYQLNEKDELKSLTISPFTLNIVISKKDTCQQSISFLKATLFKKFKTRKSSKASFQIAWHNRMPKRILLPQEQSYYPLDWKTKSSKQVYFINIRSFSIIFCQNRFYSLNQNLLLGVTIKIIYFQ